MYIHCRAPWQAPLLISDASPLQNGATDHLHRDDVHAWDSRHHPHCILLHDSLRGHTILMPSNMLQADGMYTV